MEEYDRSLEKAELNLIVLPFIKNHIFQYQLSGFHFMQYQSTFYQQQKVQGFRLNTKLLLSFKCHISIENCE